MLYKKDVSLYRIVYHYYHNEKYTSHINDYKSINNEY